jgi:hypothetical protein
MKTEGVKFLDPAVHINVDNYGTNDIKELDKKANEYLNGLRGTEFSLEESNPNIKFTLSKDSVWHLINSSGLVKLKITKQLPDIFKQGIIFGVEDETKGDKNVLHILKCGTYIMVKNEIYLYYFVLKLKRNSQNFIHDGNIDISKPEKERTA